MGLEEIIKFISKNKIKTDYPCNLKLWLVYFSPFYFRFCKKML